MLLSWDGVTTGRSVDREREREERVHNVHNVHNVEEYPALCSKTKPSRKGNAPRLSLVRDNDWGAGGRISRIIPLSFGKWVF